MLQIQPKRICRATIHAIVTLAFLLLLVLPLEFYRHGYASARSTAMQAIAVFFASTLLGYRSVKSSRAIGSAPIGFETRLAIGFSLTISFLVLGSFIVSLGVFPTFIVMGLQNPLLLGLFGSGVATAGTPVFTPRWWKDTHQLSLISAIATGCLLWITAFWWVWRWWSLLVPFMLVLAHGLAKYIGSSVRQWVIALKDVWRIARRMGPPVGGFAAGYFLIAFIFAGLLAAVWRSDNSAFRGLPTQPSFIDFTYYSVMTITTTGYGDVAPFSAPAKLLASAESLFGIAWTIVIFAAVIIVVQRRSDPVGLENVSGTK